MEQLDRLMFFSESYAYTAYMDAGIEYPEKQKVAEDRMMMIHALIDEVY